MWHRRVSGLQKAHPAEARIRVQDYGWAEAWYFVLAGRNSNKPPAPAKSLRSFEFRKRPLQKLHDEFIDNLNLLVAVLTIRVRPSFNTAAKARAWPPCRALRHS